MATQLMEHYLRPLNMNDFPLLYDLQDGTHVLVNQLEPEKYEFHLTRLNSEKYNFTWTNSGGEGMIEDNYELRFNSFEQEAFNVFKQKLPQVFS
jgi:hypothetical protein